MFPFGRKELKMSLGARIKQTRLDLGLTNIEMAKSLNVDRGTLARYENDIRKPDAEFLTLFIEKYNVDANWLLLGYVKFPNENKGVDLRSLYPDLPGDKKVEELIKCLQVPVVYHTIISDFIVYRKKFKTFIKEHFEEKEDKKSDESIEGKKKEG
jgi:transcriptional regulator with XRE-family HTH domain